MIKNKLSHFCYLCYNIHKEKKLGVIMVSSEFISKIEYNCHKKEGLFNKNKFKYAIRSMFAGAFLTVTTAAGAIAADLSSSIVPNSGKFLFPFYFRLGTSLYCFLEC